MANDVATIPVGTTHPRYTLPVDAASLHFRYHIRQSNPAWTKERITQSEVNWETSTRCHIGFGIPWREEARNPGWWRRELRQSPRTVDTRGSKRKRAKYHPISNCFQPSKILSKNAISGSTLKGTTKSFIVPTPTEHQRSTARRSTGGVAYSGATRGAERSRCKCRSRRPTEVCLVGPTYVL